MVSDFGRTKGCFLNSFFEIEAMHCPNHGAAVLPYLIEDFRKETDAFVLPLLPEYYSSSAVPLMAEDGFLSGS